MATEKSKNMSMTNIGKVLFDKGIITIEQAEKIIQYQRKNKVKFGEAAVELGYLSHEDVQQALADQFDYSYLQVGQSAISEEVISAYQPFSHYAEEIRGLRSQILLRWLSAGNKSVAILGCNEEASQLAANLAVCFAQSNEKTLLIDANLRSPKQQRYFATKNKQGLSEVLANRCSLTDALELNTEIENLTILNAGAKVPNPQELLSRDQVVDVVESLNSQFEVIIYDTPPCNDFADAQLIAAKVKGVIIVAEKNKASAASLKKIAEQCQQIGAEIIGAVYIE